MVAVLKPGVDVVRATKMEDHDPNDWTIVAAAFKAQNGDLGERVLRALEKVERYTFGYQVDRYTHCLQTATRALRAGADEETVVCALLHDIGDTLGSYNHPDIAAAILKPFVSEANLWMVQHHGIFQGHNFFHHIGLDRDMRDQFAGHPHAERTAEFVQRYDNPAFDPAAPMHPLSHFEPMLRRVMASPKQSVYKAAMEQA